MTGMRYGLAPTVVVRSFEHETVLLDRNTLQMYSLSVPAFRQLEELLRAGAGDEWPGSDDAPNADEAWRFARTLLRMGILVDGGAVADPARREPARPRPIRLPLLRARHGGRRK